MKVPNQNNRLFLLFILILFHYKLWMYFSLFPFIANAYMYIKRFKG